MREPKGCHIGLFNNASKVAKKGTMTTYWGLGKSVGGASILNHSLHPFSPRVHRGEKEKENEMIQNLKLTCKYYFHSNHATLGLMLSRK